MPGISGLIKDLTSSKCKYFDQCEFVDPHSKTCNDGGGVHCGRWRQFQGLRL